MEFGSPEQVNGRLDAQQFLSHPADLDYFARLASEVQSAELPDGVLDIPDPHSAHAWRRLYAIYKKQKVGQAPNDPNVIPATRFETASRSRWNDYLRQRERLIIMSRRGAFDDRVAEYVGLHPGDLDDPIPPPSHPDSEFGRYAGWTARADRINFALGQLEFMSPEERATIPRIISERRAEKENAKLKRRLESLEAILNFKQLKEEVENHG